MKILKKSLIILILCMVITPCSSARADLIGDILDGLSPPTNVDRQDIEQITDLIIRALCNRYQSTFETRCEDLGWGNEEECDAEGDLVYKECRTGMQSL